MSGWQPIATAPMDGTIILGYSEDLGQRETHMRKYGEGSIGYAKWLAGDGPLNVGWDWHEPFGGFLHTWKPTHWQPLPTPPKDTE